MGSTTSSVRLKISKGTIQFCPSDDYVLWLYLYWGFYENICSRWLAFLPVRKFPSCSAAIWCHICHAGSEPSHERVFRCYRSKHSFWSFIIHSHSFHSTDAGCPHSTRLTMQEKLFNPPVGNQLFTAYKSSQFRPSTFLGWIYEQYTHPDKSCTSPIMIETVKV